MRLHNTNYTKKTEIFVFLSVRLPPPVPVLSGYHGGRGYKSGRGGAAACHYALSPLRSSGRVQAGAARQEEREKDSPRIT